MPFAKGYIPANFKDLSGLRFGRLLVMSRDGFKGPMSAWRCRCDCGKEVLRVSNRVLKKGQASCGCARLKHGLAKTPLYGIWNTMVQRCINKNVKCFDRYGGRGITVCDRWRKFENFLADMGMPPAGHSIERKDNDRGYEPGNCVWLPIDKQAQNRRSTVYIEVLGERLCIAEAARRLSVSASSLARWHKNGDTARIQSAQQ